MSNVESMRSRFFPKGKETRTERTERNYLKRNDKNRKAELDQVSERGDVRVAIGEAIKDFGRIKKMADSAPPLDRSEKISYLRKQIESGDYEIDYEALADKILSQEFEV